MSVFITSSSVPPPRSSGWAHQFSTINPVKRAPRSGLATRTLLLIAVLVLSAGLVVSTKLKAQTRYEVKAVPPGANLSSVVLGINQHGDVTGYTIEGNVYRGFLLRAGTNQPEDLGNLGGQLTAG